MSATGEETEGAVVNGLNPVKEHREYCPWSNAVSQNGREKSSTSNLAGWEIVLTVLKNEYYLRSGREKENERVGRPVTEVGVESLTGEGGDDEMAEMRERDVKDKERWARLRRVKSLFDTKSTKNLQRTNSTKSKAA